VLSKLFVENAGDHACCMLGCTVQPIASDRADRRQRAHDDNVPLVSRGDHVLCRDLRAVHDALDVDVHVLVCLCLGLGLLRGGVSSVSMLSRGTCEINGPGLRYPATLNTTSIDLYCCTTAANTAFHCSRLRTSSLAICFNTPDVSWVLALDSV